MNDPTSLPAPRPFILRHCLAAACVVPLAACVSASAHRPDFPDRPPEEERLVNVPASPAPAATAADAAAPSLAVLGVSAQPARLGPGEETSMVIHYRVDGLAPGGRVTVEEWRSLEKDGAVIREWRDAVERTAGAHTSHKPLRVPSDAGPGVYTLKVVISSGEARSTSSGIFEVR